MGFRLLYAEKFALVCEKSLSSSHILDKSVIYIIVKAANTFWVIRAYDISELILM